MTDMNKFLEVYRRRLSIRACRDELDITYGRSRKYYLEAVAAGHISPRVTVKNEERKDAANGNGAAPEPVIGGRLSVRAASIVELHPGRTTRFLLSCAQNNTEIHEGLWKNLLVMASHYKAQIILARTVYNRFSTSADMDKKLIIGGQRARQSVAGQSYHWDERLEPFFIDERLQLAPGLVWCGETNVIPTATQPLSGFDTYTGRDSMILPHNKIAMLSISSHFQEGTKIMYTTGTLTQHNYIQRKAGQLAEFHHCYGALLVEVDTEGTWFCRQVNADSEGTIHDWDVRVKDGQLTTGNRLEAISWGDLHTAYGDPVAYNLAWGDGGMMQQLQPHQQFMHDLLDFRTRNPHNIKRNLNLQAFAEYCLGHKSVRQEVQDTARFLRRTLRPWCKTLVVSSNHDNFLVEWLERLGDFRKDPINAVYFLEAAHHLWRQTEASGGKSKPNMTRWAMLTAQQTLIGRSSNLKFLDEDESHIICPDASGGIECGMHGHQGPNGTRGNVMALAKMARKANIGDKHSAGIYNGLYVGGILGKLDQGYNSGPGSWSQSNILTYPNGKRAIQTIYDEKVRAK